MTRSSLSGLSAVSSITAYGASGVYVGHDLPASEWVKAIRQALDNFTAHPFILQRFERSRLFDGQYFDFEENELRTFSARVRLCPYYFVVGDDTKLGGVLATVCPSDKKILHGMPEAVMAPGPTRILPSWSAWA